MQILVGVRRGCVCYGRQFRVCDLVSTTRLRVPLAGRKMIAQGGAGAPVRVALTRIGEAEPWVAFHKELESVSTDGIIS